MILYLQKNEKIAELVFSLNIIQAHTLKLSAVKPLSRLFLIAYPAYCERNLKLLRVSYMYKFN